MTAVAATEWGIFAGTHGDGVFRLDPTTGEWERLGLDHAIVSSILLLPGSTPRLLVGLEPYSDEQTEAAVFATEDRGRTWQPWDGGLAAARGGRGWAYGLASDPGNPARLFMSYFDLIARSEDGGRTWALVSGTVRDIGGGNYRAIVASPARDGTVWAGGETSIFSGRLLRSRDWGSSWESIPVNPRQGEPVWEDNGILSLAVDPRHPSRLLAGLKLGYLLRSEDAGATWRRAFRTADSGAFLWGIAFVDSSAYVVSSERFRPPPSPGGWPVTDLGLYRSGDGGASWEQLAVPAGVGGGEALAVDARDRLLIGTRGSGVWRVEP